ncbi:MAG: peroxiredoxin family protein [Armatimonadota bacterium]
MRLTRSTAVLAVVASAFLLVGLKHTWAAPAAPDFTIPSIDGKPVKLSSFRNRKVVVISFFATWCPPCRMEMPHLQKLSTKYGKKDVVFLAVSVDAPGTDLKPFIQQYRLTFPVLHDTKGAAAKAYNVEAIPLLVIVDKKGRIVERIEGFEPDMERSVSAKIDAALSAR